MRKLSESSWYERIPIVEGVLWRGPQQAAVAAGFKLGIKLIFDTFRNKFSPSRWSQINCGFYLWNKFEGRGLILRRFVNSDDSKVFM